MPWLRTKLLPGSKILQAQKRWLSWLPFGLHIRTYIDLRTPINVLKTRSVALEDELMRTRSQIEILQKKYDASVKFMETKVKKYDSDSGAVTQWKYESNRWWQLSIFQWATPYVEEPIEFDPKMYRFGGRGPADRSRARPKDVELDVNSLRKDHESFKDEVEAQADPDEKSSMHVASFTPGDGFQGMQKRKGESQQDFDKRKEESRGTLDGLD